MKIKVSDMTPTEDPSIFEYKGTLYHVPRSLPVKILNLLTGLLILGFGFSFLWEPGGRFLFGNTAEGRVVRVVKSIPGKEDISYRYRREYEPERDRAITFKHFVEVLRGGETRVMQIGVNSRVSPVLNVNDRVRVSFYDDDEYAYETWALRSWGIGILYIIVGLSFAGFGLPMLLAVGKPIEIDPEAPAPGKEDETQKPAVGGSQNKT